MTTMETNRREGSGPCPRSAGNLDCNRDCAEVDTQVLRAAITANKLAEQAGQEAAQTPGAGLAMEEIDDPKPVPPEQFISPSSSPSPSASVKLNSTVTNTINSTTIREVVNDTTVAEVVSSRVYEIPTTGFYKDAETNLTYRIVGDQVFLASTGSKFQSLVS